MGQFPRDLRGCGKKKQVARESFTKTNLILAKNLQKVAWVPKLIKVEEGKKCIIFGGLCSISGEIFPNLHILFTYTFQLCFSTFSVKKRWYTRYVWPINWIISLISSIEQTDRKVALLLYIYNVIKVGIRLGKNFLIPQSSLLYLILSVIMQIWVSSTSGWWRKTSSPSFLFFSISILPRSTPSTINGGRYAVRLLQYHIRLHFRLGA